jgi:hypothetical protein
MDACEPRVRRRGFFLHSDTGEPDTGEHENPEGFVVRVRIARSPGSHKDGSVHARSAAGARLSGGRRGIEPPGLIDEGPRFRSGSATGSRQRSHSPR